MSSPPCDITLFAPGLLAAPPLLEKIPAHERPDLKLLETMLSRATVSDWGTGEADADLFRLFGIEVDAPPVAALTARGEGFDTSRGWWLCADPVCLVPDRDQLVMLGDDSPLRGEESEQLRETLNAHFAADGWQIEASSPGRWFIRLEQAMAIQTTSPAQVVGQGIHPFLPRGEDAGRWRGYLNEAQMLLHDHPVNRRREAEGRSPINSIWVWGGGVLPSRGEALWDAVYGKPELLQALADYHGGQAETWIPSPEDNWNGRVLIATDSCRLPARSGDPFAWLDCVARIQAQWLVPLQTRLRTGSRLTLLPGDGRAFTLEEGALSAWKYRWRRRRSLEQFLSS